MERKDLEKDLEDLKQQISEDQIAAVHAGTNSGQLALISRLLYMIAKIVLYATRDDD